MNALGMAIGAAILLGLSFASGEAQTAPTKAATWLGLVYLVLIGSIVLFATYLFVLHRWTASGTSYIFVLFPVVAVVFASLFQDERITAGLVAGGALVVAGVYVGALLQTGRRESKAEPRPELAGVPADCVRCP
jgi:drug/metabolite transporter (DMT)-like permease